MKLVAVALANPGDFVGGTWIEFYWAEDLAHAEEQAWNANPDAEILVSSWVPYVDERSILEAL